MANSAKSLCRHEPFTIFAHYKYAALHPAKFPPVFSSGHPDNSACTDLSAIAVVHIANVMQVFKICTLLLPSEMFNAYPQSLELVEHPKVSCLCVTA
jgi:hypothetical protein